MGIQKGRNHLTVTLAHELGGLTSVSRLELTGRHDNGRNVQLLEGKVALEGLTLSLATPDSCTRTCPSSAGTNIMWEEAADLIEKQVITEDDIDILGVNTDALDAFQKASDLMVSSK
jgi:hypothetical protein